MSFVIFTMALCPFLERRDDRKIVALIAANCPVRETARPVLIGPQYSLDHRFFASATL
jgi:hypothetical protein